MLWSPLCEHNTVVSVIIFLEPYFVYYYIWHLLLERILDLNRLTPPYIPISIEAYLVLKITKNLTLYELRFLLRLILTLDKQGTI